MNCALYILYTKKMQIESIKSAMRSIVNNRDTIKKYTTTELRNIIDYAGKEYYNSTDAGIAVTLPDPVYDFIRDTYERRQKTKLDPMYHVPEPLAPSSSISSSSPHSPHSSSPSSISKADKGERLVKLPVELYSMDKINHGEGQLAPWVVKYRGPYVVSTKMDGGSALYFTDINGYPKLYSRGKKGMAQDLSYLLNFLNLPTLQDNEMVRGELIIRKSNFLKVFRAFSKDSGELKYKDSRTTVSGLINQVGSKSDSIDTDLLKYVDFIAYEYLSDGLTCAEQLCILKERHFNVVEWQMLTEVSEDALSTIIDDYLENYDYDIDGLIVCDDTVSMREIDRNPRHARAYKKILERKITTVTGVEWKASMHYMLKPTILFEPVVFVTDTSTVTVSRATGNNAKYIVANGVGVGSVVEVIRSGGVIPKITSFIEKVEPLMPKTPYRWNETGVDIMIASNTPNAPNDSPASLHSLESLEDTEENAGINRDIRIKRLSHFTSTLGVKGLGEVTIGKLYDLGFTTMQSLVSMTENDIKSVGPKIAQNIVTGLHKALNPVPICRLMYASMIFGRGIGEKKLQCLFDKYPDFLEMTYDMSNDQVVSLIMSVNSFAEKSALAITNGLDDFTLFCNSISGYIDIDFHQRSDDLLPTLSGAPSAPKVIRDLEGQHVCLTGFRDANMQKNIESRGGIIQTAINGKTNIVIKKDGSYENKKTEEAVKRGLQIYTRDTFV